MRDIFRTRDECVNHEPKASDLRILRMFVQHPSGLSAYKPIEACGLLLLLLFIVLLLLLYSRFFHEFTGKINYS